MLADTAFVPTADYTRARGSLDEGFRGLTTPLLRCGGRSAICPVGLEIPIGAMPGIE